MFASADVVIVTRIDFLPYFSCDMARIEDNIRRVNTRTRSMRVSATHGESLEEWYDGLRSNCRQPAA